MPVDRLVCPFLVGACASSSDPADATVQAPEVVSADTFERARQYVAAVDYLPFEFTSDGCDARGYYLSMGS
jgi:hypothetical protein